MQNLKYCYKLIGVSLVLSPLVVVALKATQYQTGSNQSSALSGLSANSQLANMRALVAFRKKPDGSYCQVDVRGNAKLTPSFVKPASFDEALLKSDISFCSSKEKKSFQKIARGFSLKGGQVQKTSVAGVALGALLKSAGFGCAFGAGLSLLFDVLGGSGFYGQSDKKTQSSATCIDCVEKQKPMDPFLKGLSGFSGVTAGIIIGDRENTPELRQQVIKELKQKIVKDLQALAVEDEVKKRQQVALNPQQVQAYIDRLEKRINQLVKEQPENQRSYQSLSDKMQKLEAKGLVKYNSFISQYSPHTSNSDQQKKIIQADIDNYVKAKNKFEQFKQKFSGLEDSKTRWSKIAHLHTSTGSSFSATQMGTIKHLVRTDAKWAVKSLYNTYEKLVVHLPKEKVSNVLLKYNNSFIKNHRFVLGGSILGGVAGAIVCEDGTSYLLTGNPKTDI